MLDDKQKKAKKQRKKERRLRNALVHGLYSKDVLLPFDNKDHFEELNRQLCAEFNPCSASEKETVLDLANAFWLNAQFGACAKLQ